MWQKLSTYPIGLDISDLSLKLVQLNKKKNRITIQSFGKVFLERGWVEEGEFKNKEKVVAAIKRLINKPRFGRVSSQQVVSCLPETKTFIKLIQIPKKTENLEKAIAEELNKHIPLSIEEVYYDYHLVKETDQEKFFIFGAAPKKFVDDYLELFKRAGLIVVALEIESVAIARSLLKSESPFQKEKSLNRAVLDIGARRSSIFVYSDNTILFNVSVPVSGQDISQKISDSLGIDYKKAELAKLVCGMEDDRCQGLISQELLKIIDQLVKKLKEVIDFYSSHFLEQGKIDEILICGGGANIKGIETLIQEKLDIKTKIGNVFTNLNQPQKVSINLSQPQEIFTQDFMETYSLDSNFIKQNKINKKIGSQKKISIKQDSSITYATAIGLALRKIFID